jgi:hypothetical protein
MFEDKHRIYVISIVFAGYMQMFSSTATSISGNPYGVSSLDYLIFISQDA